MARLDEEERPGSPRADRGGAAAPLTVLDLGTGTGRLALAAARRWPEARVIGLDASAAMLSAARHRGVAPAASRLEWLLADASAIPLADTCVDLVMSAFVLQLVGDRLVVLREARRVLRPGGPIGLVGWLQDDLRLAPDEEFDEAVYDLGLEDPAGEGATEVPGGGETEAAGEGANDTAGDFESPEQACGDLAAAGFEGVEAWQEQLEFAWTRESYLEFKERYDEADLFASLDPGQRARLRERLTERWSRLPDADFVLRAPLVMATGRRPDR